VRIFLNFVTVRRPHNSTFRQGGWLVTQLVPRTKHRRHAKRIVRDSVQIAEATVLDALLHEGAP
jgi:hypothetical protein